MQGAAGALGTGEFEGVVGAVLEILQGDSETVVGAHWGDGDHHTDGVAGGDNEAMVEVHLHRAVGNEGGRNGGCGVGRRDVDAAGAVELVARTDDGEGLQRERRRGLVVDDEKAEGAGEVGEMQGVASFGARSHGQLEDLTAAGGLIMVFGREGDGDEIGGEGGGGEGGGIECAVDFLGRGVGDIGTAVVILNSFDRVVDAYPLAGDPSAVLAGDSHLGTTRQGLGDDFDAVEGVGLIVSLAGSEGKQKEREQRERE